jgi:predicted NBD/HSP70 family sugar kinase
MRATSAHVVAVDLGGTKAIGALADAHGTVLAERTEPTRTDSAEALIGQLRALAHGLAQDAGVAWADVRALGVGVPGTVDPASGRMRLAYNIPDLGELSLADELAALGDDLPVVVENDVNAAAIGERRWGWARDAQQFAFVAIGTGIGAGLVVDGELRRGRRGAAGEIGYLPFGGDPFRPAAQRRGALEEAVSGRGIVADFERALAAGGASRLSAGSTSVEIFAAARDGDELARACVEREARLVAMTVAAVASVVAPELVVLGGGVGANELLVEPVRRFSRELLAQPLRIERSALGPRASLVGALALALDVLPDGAAPSPAVAVPQSLNGGE